MSPEAEAIKAKAATQEKVIGGCLGIAALLLIMLAYAWYQGYVVYYIINSELCSMLTLDR